MIYTNQIEYKCFALFSLRFLVFFSRDENLLNSTFPAMSFFFLKFYLYSTFKPLDITAFFLKYMHHELKIQKNFTSENNMYQEDMVEAQNNGHSKAATLLVRIM